MHYLKPSANGRNVLAIRAQLGYIQGYGGDVAPPNNRFYSGGENDLRGFDIRGATPYGYVPSRINFQLTNPDGTCVPRDPTNPEDNQCIQVPLPVYGIASIGGDTNLTTNVEYRIPVVGPFTFSFFDDFGIDAAISHDQLKQSPEGFASLTAPLYGCPVTSTTAPARAASRAPRSASSATSSPWPAPTLCRACPSAPELGVIMPIINAPVPPLLRLQPAAPLRAAVLQRRPAPATRVELLGRAHHPRHVPAGRRRRLHLPGSDPGLRRADTSSASRARPSA